MKKYPFTEYNDNNAVKHLHLSTVEHLLAKITRRHNILCHIMINCDQHTASMLTSMLIPKYERYIYFIS